MENSKVLKAILIISGLIALGVGLTLLIMPVGLYASVQVDVSNQVSLLSDLRATGGSLSVIGVLIIAGAFRPQLAFTSTLIATLVYLAYAFSRLIGVALDSMPENSIVLVGVIELVIGVLCLFALIKYRQKD